MKRVLVLAYYFPPAGGAAAQRIVNLIRHLPDHDWHPTVLTVREGAFPEADASLVAKVPESVDVYRTSWLDPLQVYGWFTESSEDEGGLPAGSLGDDASWLESVARWIRANVFIPDARIGWWPFAVREGMQLLGQNSFDCVLSTGAPHSVHLIGRSLHRRTDCPWVADLHDPWTDITYYDELPHSRWARRLDEHLERSVLREASTVTTVSPGWARLFSEKETNRYRVVQNGFDPTDFPEEADLELDYFSLTYTGRLYASRNPSSLWTVFQELKQADALRNVTFRMMGTLDGSVREEITRRDLGDLLDYRAFVSHSEVCRELVKSTLLLLVIERFEHDAGLITSKLYEYLGAGRPVLGIGPPDGDAAQILEETQAGQMFDWEDTEGIRRFLTAHIDAWRNNEFRQGASSEVLASYTWQEQARVLADVLTTTHRTTAAAPDRS